ncbi:MAG: DUF2281 domain-containing protein [Chitinophagales bacterium]|nr:DUF2281 domain-containing protein [Chitinophagales bacterium]
MTRENTIESAIQTIKRLPNDKLQEVSNFISFLLKQYEEEQLTQGIQKLSADSMTFEFLSQEEDIYSIDDLKEVYNG